MVTPITQISQTTPMTPITTSTAPNASIRVLLADDHTLVRAGLRALLDAMPDVEVVAEASDGLEAARLAELHQPSIALLDISMPVMTGLVALREIRVSSPRTKVVLLSMYNDREYVTEAIQSGAAGYLIKDAAVGELAQAIAAVQRGDTYLSPSVSRKLAEAFVNRAEPAQEASLTARQTEILRLVAQGHSSKEIARKLDLSIKTIETHRSQIMDRLSIRDLAGLVRYAIRNQIIGDEP